VVAVGDAVKEWKIGDEVFGFLPFPMDIGKFLSWFGLKGI
jgi:hypothetical protein